MKQLKNFIKLISVNVIQFFVILYFAAYVKSFYILVEYNSVVLTKQQFFFLLHICCIFSYEIELFCLLFHFIMKIRD